MVQRVVRQIGESGICDSVTIATSISQADVIANQLGNEISIVTEPERRDTFPAIALASAYLAYEKRCSADEVVVVMPCDVYTEDMYFQTIAHMADLAGRNVAELVLMGIAPTYPSVKFGYVVPEQNAASDDVYNVSRFTEKPDEATAEKLIAEGAFWNGGVFAFRLGYIMKIVEGYIRSDSFAEIRSSYGAFPKISFDYEVAEKARSVSVVRFSGKWRDLGTWNTLTEELPDRIIGKAIMDDDSGHTHVINELQIPVICIGAQDMVVAASCDGILVAKKDRSEHIKVYAEKMQCMPMYEEHAWGEHTVVDRRVLPDGSRAVTKQVNVKAGKTAGCHTRRNRTEIWTVINGSGILTIDGEIRHIGRGDTVNIGENVCYEVRAETELCFMAVMIGDSSVDDTKA